MLEEDTEDLMKKEVIFDYFTTLCSAMPSLSSSPTLKVIYTFQGRGSDIFVPAEALALTVSLMLCYFC
jgi:hypothetical protein